MVFYAVANGRKNGIFLTWKDCGDSITGYKNSVYKKFATRLEAEQFINSKYEYPCAKPKTIESFFTQSKKEPVKEFISDYYVYTDGSCSNNGKPNAVAGIGIFFGIDDIRNVSQQISGKQTNNVAELSAIIQTYNIIKADICAGKKVTIVSDSEYAIKCVSSYGEKCYNKKWDVDIPNKDLVKIAYELYKGAPNVQFMHIMAHTNNTDIHSIGNYHADRLANQSIGLNDCPYNKSH